MPRTRGIASTRILLAALIAVAIHAQSAFAQEGISDPTLHNLRHPPDTVTAPLGKLGRVDKVGTGPVPMVLIPGAAFGGGVWKDFMERNRDAYTMYAVTPPGYEGTPPPPWSEGDDYNQRAWTDAFCNAVAKLIADEKLDRPIIVGHHMLGDHYALRIALDHPDRVRGVVVVSGTPSMAFAAFGANKPGQPVQTASLEQRRQMVQSMWIPFYRTVTEKMWKAGSFQPRVFTRDATRGKKLYNQQVAVPIPTQLRYFLEYMTTDLDLELAKLKTPLLVLLPEKEWTLDAALDAYRESNEAMFGDRENARAAWTNNLTMMWGDVTEGVRWMYDAKFRWERLRDALPKMTLRTIPDSEIFIMDDQPKAFDRELRDFAAGLK